MKKLKKILFAAFTVAILSCLLCQPAFAAISESDVQAQVDAVGKEAVSGNVFIWFLCAIGFLKVGQKIDSFLSSLGVNVGHTGGSMLAEAMIAARGIGGIKNFSSHHFGGGRNSSSTNVNSNGGKGSGGFGAGFASGGLAGVVSRKVTNSAIKTATTTPGSKPSGLGSLLGDAAAGGIGGHMYASSVSKGGNFANNVIGSVATGSISQMGSISGEKAAEALHSYMGYAALESGAENVPTFQNVEIGGGRITGTSDALNTKGLLDLMLAQNPDTKTVGLLYSKSEDSSKQPIEDAKAYLEGKGIRCVEKTGTTTDEVTSAVDALIAEKVDAVFTPTDNTIMTAELAIYEKFLNAKIPQYCGADSFALNGAFVGYGVDYTKLGTITADMVVQVLVDGKDPATLPVTTFDNGIAMINTESCTALGYDLTAVKQAFDGKCSSVLETTTQQNFD